MRTANIFIADYNIKYAGEFFSIFSYYRCGVIDAFNEVVKAGVKDLALSHPSTQEEIEEVIPFAKQICEKYGTHYEVEPNLLITDLFPYSANKSYRTSDIERLFRW